MNAFGEDPQTKNAHLLQEHNYGTHAKGHVMGTCLRNHLMMHDMMNGLGPNFMDTPTAMKKLAETMSPKEIKHLDAEAWEDFLDMAIGQVDGLRWTTRATNQRSWLSRSIPLALRFTGR